MQFGLWRMKVDHVHLNPPGEGRISELIQGRIQSVLPLMGSVNEDEENQSINGRCCSMSSMRYAMVSSYFSPGSAFTNLDASTVVAQANSLCATDYSQRTLACLLAMQLVGAGYSIQSESGFFEQEPGSLPLIGASGGFQGCESGEVLLPGMDTLPAEVEKLTQFMQTVRGLAKGLLREHEISRGHEASLGVSDQLAHRVRLVLLSADPKNLQAKPHVLKPLVYNLDLFERGGIAGHPNKALAQQLVIQLQHAKTVLLNS